MAVGLSIFIKLQRTSACRRVVWPRAVTVVLDKLSKHKNCTDKALQLALSWLAQDAGFETKKAILRGRGLDPKEAHTAFGAFMAGVSLPIMPPSRSNRPVVGLLQLLPRRITRPYSSGAT